MIRVFFFFIFCPFCLTAQNLTDSLGRRQGHWVIYGIDRSDSGYPDSVKVEEGNFVNNKKEGFWIKYHEDGKTPKLKGEYQNNRPKGVYMKIGSSGSITETGYFDKSRYHDSLKRYHDNGQPEYEAWYNKDGKEEGKVNFFYSNGQLEYTYCAKDGIPYDIYHYDISGKLIGTQPGPIICTISKKETVCTDETDTSPPPHTPDTPNTDKFPFNRDGYNKIFNPDGEIWQDGTFKNGQLWDGKVYVYDRDGILLRVKVFKNSVYCCDGQL